MTDQEAATFLIAGGGLVGHVLSLALEKHLGISADICEKGRGFEDGKGVALRLDVCLLFFSFCDYFPFRLNIHLTIFSFVQPDGFRVLRDIDPALMQEIRSVGYRTP